MAVVQSLKASGAEMIIVAEPAARRREFAKQFGAHHVLDPTAEDLVAKVRGLCDGRGANIAFDAAAEQLGVEHAIIPIIKKKTIVNIAVWDKPISLHPNQLTFRERNYMGVATFVRGDFEDVINAIASGKWSPEDTRDRPITIRSKEN